ncbi:hypothetical protein SUDANB121_05605 [Nocardiopsis dassonvillei]|uniref:nuclear transport factor 2 family protein n=1 Tax=Nocardiopsis dassonvillei TaxID=2014 RepID=UPI003F56118C
MTDPTDSRTRVDDLLHRFYRLVDTGRVETLARLFTEDAVYRRPGYEARIGPEGLLRFYGQERAISRGAHTVLDVVQSEGHAVALGTFEGLLKTGDPISLRYADHFRLSPDGRIAGRDTYFFTPLA